MNNRKRIAHEFAKIIKSDDIKLIMLYGSVARGDDTEESDIDILIVSPIANELKPKIHKIAINMILEKNEVISPRLMTEEHFNRTKDNPFLTNVLKDGVKIGKNYKCNEC
ncbi:nucleotidyltransferase domain-containing protein [Methanobrevibacter sp.]|uniref:nucleotidyltransferase domain-containing protein n=1 Tax=Methanobrevibacter sp. TaxID=66852 RepID=UPI00386561B1